MPAATILAAEDFRHLNNQTGRGSPQRYVGALWDIYFSAYGITPAATRGVAFAINPLAGTAPGLGIRVAEFYEENGARLHCQLEWNSGGVLALRGAAGTILNTSTLSIPAVDGFHHVDIIPTIGDSGSFKVKVNGVEWMNLSGIDIRNGGTGVIDTIKVNAHSRALTDLVVTDGADYLGDVATAYAPPLTAGTYTAGTANGAGTLLGCVDQPTYDEDTTFIGLAKTSLPRKVSFNVTLPTATAILAVCPRARRRKDDAGVNATRLLLISGATETDGGADIASPTSYADAIRVVSEDPANPGNPFTSAQSIQIGVSRVV